MDTTKKAKRQPGPPWLMLFLALVLGLTMFSNLTSAREVPGMTLDLAPEIASGSPSGTGSAQAAKPSPQKQPGQPSGGAATSTTTALQGRTGVSLPRTETIAKAPVLDPTRSPLKRLP